ncbi:MAG: hypothetical protein QXR54_02595 [Nanopusillaceae archaeon]
MVATKPTSKIQITKKLEDILNTFNKEVFNKDKKIFVEVKDLGYDKIIFGEVFIPAFYKDKKIYIESNYLDFILNNYKSNPELIKKLIGTFLHENIHAILDANLEKEKENIIVHEGLATLVRDLYKTIILEYKIDTNNSLEEILEEMGKYVIEKFKDKEYLRNLEEKLRKKFKKEIIVVLHEILKKYNKCIDIPYTSSEILDLEQEIKYYVLYKIPSLILQKNPGILKVLEDLSSEKFPIKEYQKIIEEEYEKLKEKYLIEDTLNCLENKLNEYLEYLKILSESVESKLSDLEKRLK